MSEANEYLSKRKLSYDEYVAELKEKYGEATVDYFSENSYRRLMNNEIKSLATARQISRTSEGLYCHHVDEDKQISISSVGYIRAFQIPFDCQRKERLVYCNLIEHAILHVLIATEHSEPENNQQLGLSGYAQFIRPELIERLIDGVVPQAKWRLDCYEVIKMPKDEAKKIIKGLDNFLIKNNKYVNKRILKSYELVMKEGQFI